jgi:hypothetical protein
MEMFQDFFQMSDSEMIVDGNRYDKCCLFDTFHNCGPTSQNRRKLFLIISYMNSDFYRYAIERKRLGWSDHCVDFGTLSMTDVTPYLISLGMVSEPTDSMIMSEKQLIMNRIASYVTISRNSSVICPLHRYTYGVHWKEDERCGHPDHPPNRARPKYVYLYYEVDFSIFFDELIGVTVAVLSSTLPKIFQDSYTVIDFVQNIEKIQRAIMVIIMIIVMK